MQRNGACGEEIDLAQPDIASDVWTEADTADVFFDEEADGADWARTIVPATHSVGAIGHEVGEALFLDETEDYRLSAKRVDSTSPFDLFADEEALPATSDAVGGPEADPAPALAAERARELPSMFTSFTPARTVTAPRAINQPPALRVNLLGVSLLVLAVGAMTTLHACRTASNSPVAIWHLIAR